MERVAEAMHMLCHNTLCRHKDLEFHSALFGPFVVTMIESSDYRNGYINATNLCNDAGKQVDQWLNSNNTKKLFDYYKYINHDLTYLYKNEDVICYNDVDGIYIHYRLILDLILWISPEHYDRTFDMILADYVHLVMWVPFEYLNLMIDKYEKNKKSN